MEDTLPEMSLNILFNEIGRIRKKKVSSTKKVFIEKF
jgi:hypothetical protein